MRGAFAVVAALAAVSCACAQVRPVVERVHALEGMGAVVPVEVDPKHRVAEPVEVRISEGGAITGRLERELTLPPEPCAPQRWLDPGPRGRLIEPDPGERAGDRLRWRLVLTGVHAGAAWLEIGDERVGLDWIEQPFRSAREAGVAGSAFRPSAAAAASPWTSPVPRRVREQRSFQEQLASAALHPDTAWRVRLAVGELIPSDPDAAATPAPVVIEGRRLLASSEQRPDAIELSAMIREARWQRALRRLWQADPGVSEAVRAALAGSARFPRSPAGSGDISAPLWRASGEDAADLLARVESMEGSGEALAELARDWLDRLPSAAGWVMSDAGGAGGGAAIGVVNTAGGSVLAIARPHGGWTASSGTTPIGRLEAAVLDLSSPGPGTEGAERVVVNAGTWRGERSVIPGDVSVRPPGLEAAGFFSDWTLPSWLASAGSGVEVIPPASTRTAARLEFRPSGVGDGELAENAQGAHWSLFIECAPSAGAGMDGEFVDVWLGPAGTPAVVLRATPDGAIERIGGRSGVYRNWSPTPREPDRWTAMIELPDWAIGDNGTVELGIVREDACGNRWAWPRPLLPWQDEPGRLRVDLRAWNSLDSLSP